MSEKPEALRLAEELDRDAKRELFRYLDLDKAAAELRRQHEEIERLRDENRLWKSRCIALVWKGDTDNITAGRLQSAAKEIDAALRREEVKP